LKKYFEAAEEIADQFNTEEAEILELKGRYKIMHTIQ